jgi:hypothetical protein
MISLSRRWRARMESSPCTPSCTILVGKPLRPHRRGGIRESSISVILVSCAVFTSPSLSIHRPIRLPLSTHPSTVVDLSIYRYRPIHPPLSTYPSTVVFIYITTHLPLTYTTTHLPLTYTTTHLPLTCLYLHYHTPTSHLHPSISVP